MLPIMAAQGYGSVVNLGSDAGPVGSSGEAVYSAAMDGVIVFQGHRTQMARHQVNVNCVRPAARISSAGADETVHFRHSRLTQANLIRAVVVDPRGTRGAPAYHHNREKT